MDEILIIGCEECDFECFSDKLEINYAAIVGPFVGKPIPKRLLLAASDEKKYENPYRYITN